MYKFRCSWGLSVEVFISLEPVFAIWFINQFDESVVSIYSRYWWWIVPRTCDMPVESENRFRWRFIFVGIIHVNFKDCLWSNRLNLERIIFDIHLNQYSNTQTIIWTVIGYSSNLKIVFQYFCFKWPKLSTEYLNFHEKQNSEVDQNYIYSIPVLLVWYFYISLFWLLLPAFSEGEAYCLVSTVVKCMIWQCSFTGMGLALLNGPVVSALGCCSGGSRSKSPTQVNCSGPGSSSSSFSALWCCSQPEKASWNRPGMLGHL